MTERPRASHSGGAGKRGTKSARSKSDADTSFLVARSWDEMRSEVGRSTERGSGRGSVRKPLVRPGGTARRASEVRVEDKSRFVSHTQGRVRGTAVNKPGKPRRKKRVVTAEMKRRRIISTTLIVLIAVGSYLGFSFLRSLISNASQQREAAIAQKNEDKSEVINNCQPGDLEVQLAAPATSMQVGAAWATTLKVTNRGLHPCYTEGGGNRLGLEVKSGDVVVFNSLQCAAEDSQIPLLLDRNKSWEMPLSWDGHIWTDCKSQAEAQPGAYVITIFNQSKKVGEPLVLTVEAPVDAKPQQSEKQGQ